MTTKRRQADLPEGQLCPYDDCCWNCGFSKAGWYICPNCKREFWAEDTDSDFEDFHAYYVGDGWSRTPLEKPEVVPLAADCGPSWGTPKESEMNVIDRIKAIQERNRKDYEALAAMTGQTVAEVEADLTAPDPGMATWQYQPHTYQVKPDSGAWLLQQVNDKGMVMFTIATFYSEYFARRVARFLTGGDSADPISGGGREA